MIGSYLHAEIKFKSRLCTKKKSKSVYDELVKKGVLFSFEGLKERQGSTIPNFSMKCLITLADFDSVF